jgi:hypothetical protein
MTTSVGCSSIDNMSGVFRRRHDFFLSMKVDRQRSWRRSKNFSKKNPIASIGGGAMTRVRHPGVPGLVASVLAAPVLTCYSPEKLTPNRSSKTQTTSLQKNSRTVVLATGHFFNPFSNNQHHQKKEVKSKPQSCNFLSSASSSSASEFEMC